MTKLKSYRRKSRKFRSIKRSVRIKSRSKKRSIGVEKCLKWVKIPREEMEDYDVGIKKCGVCKHTKMPYLVHKVQSGDYSCYKCGKDVSIRYLCLSCKKK